MTTLIVARTLTDARHCAQMMSLKSDSWRYIMFDSDTYGVNNCLVIKYGNYYFNTKWPEIDRAIRRLKTLTPIQELFVV